MKRVVWRDESVPREVASEAPGTGRQRQPRSLPLAVLKSSNYDAAVVAIAARRAHHAAQVIAAPRASNDIFKDMWIEKPLVLAANYRPDKRRTANTPSGSLTLRYNKRIAPSYAEIKKNIPANSDSLTPLVPDGQVLLPD